MDSSFPHDENSFNGRGKRRLERPDDQSPGQWASAKPNRVLLIANAESAIESIVDVPQVSAVEINMESWQSEATLFAQSGLAELLGDPKREPLVPAGHFAAYSIGYAAFTALAAVYLLQRRKQIHDVARVNGVAAIAWINWKAGAAGAAKQELQREGEEAEWPVLPCQDGHAAFVFTERDWQGVVDMIGDKRLGAPEFDSFANRAKNRDAYMSIIRPWAESKSKNELAKLFIEHSIPGAPVLKVGDLVNDPLLIAFAKANQADGTNVTTPVLPHRIEKTVKEDDASKTWTKTRKPGNSG